MLRVYLFGGLALAWHEELLSPLPSRSARSLLAYLLTYRDPPHTRDLLAGTFWPELPDATARRRLSQALWQIRRAFDPQPILLTESDAVQLDPDLPLWLDVEQFTRHHAHCTGSDAKAIEPGTACMELYQGEFLAGYYDDWIVVERERLRDMFLEVLERLVVGHKRRGEYERALLCARRLANEVPWREQAHNEVMRLCHLLGREAEALKQFETCRQALTEELGTEPSSATLALAREIAYRSDPGLTVDLPEAAAAPAIFELDGPEATDLPLVGREEERTELLAHVEALLRGLGGVVLVEGEAGVGKTRLLQTIAHDAEWRGAQVLWGAGREVEGAPPYGPLVEALSEGLTPLRIGQLEQLVESIWLQVLASLLPSLATLLPDLAPAPQLDPAQEQTRLVAALGQLLAGWSQVAPLLLVVEDLHWAGEDTLDLLAHLPAAVGEHPVLIVGSYRGEEARGRPTVWDRLQALDRAGVQQRLELRGLPAEATGELVRRSLGMAGAAPLFEARLHRETRGNPLFVLETLRTLHGEGLLVRDESGGWRTPWDETTDDYAELPLPHAVEQTIARRLDSLSPSLQRTIDLVAVLGERFGFDLLCAAGDGEPQSLLAAVRELVQRRFLDETERDYRFSHDKVRQVAYEGIDALQRSGLHRRVAQALEALQPEHVAMLAHHWTRAEEWEQGADYHQQAGDRARVVYANAEAVAHYSQALAALERLSGPVDPARRYKLHLAREAVYHLLGKREKQAEDLQALEKLAKRLDDDRRMTAALRQGNYYLSTGDYSTAHLYLEQTLQRARAEDDRHREATSLSLLGKFHGDLGDSTAAQDHFKQALAIHRAIGDYLGEVKDLSSLGTAYGLAGDYPAAKDYYKQALALSQSTKNFQMEGYNLCSLGRLSRQLGHLEAAQEYNSQALTIMRAIGHRYIEVYCLQELGNLHYILGDCMLARKTLEQAVNISSYIGNPRGEGYALSDLGLVYHNLGDDEMALAHCKQGRDRLCVVGDRWGEGGSWNYIGQALEGLGDLDAASEAYSQALTIKREIGQNAWAVEDLTGLARVALAQGRMAEALKQVDEALAWIAQHGITGLELPLLVYLTAYQVLDAAGYVERAGAVLTEAHDLLMERAAKIRDEKLRRSFLENVAAHREILAAYRESQIVPQEGRLVVLLPRADAPQGRPLRDDEYVTVTWTVDAAEDAAIQGKAARRQRRILRLLDEAEAQGAVPRDQDLARALGMSLRTLRRDVAALRAAGHALPARRRKMAS